MNKSEQETKISGRDSFAHRLLGYLLRSVIALIGAAIALPAVLIALPVYLYDTATKKNVEVKRE